MRKMPKSRLCETTQKNGHKVYAYIANSEHGIDRVVKPIDLSDNQ